MKTTILAISLICGCIVSSYSQMNQKRKNGMTADNPLRSHYEIKPALRYNKAIKPNHLRDDKIAELFLPNDSQWTSRIQGKAFVQGSMPCYEPVGIFAMRIINPDTTSRYTMLVKKY